MDFVAHPPERRARSVSLLSPGCCCCCCCCLHSVGSLAGAIYGGFKGHRPATEGLSASEAAQERLERRAADRYVIKIYWLSLLILGILATIITVIENRNESGMEGLGMSLVVIALGLPLGQLGASVLALIYINVFPPLRKSDCLRRLGRITLFSFLWGLIGAALIWILAVSLK